MNRANVTPAAIAIAWLLSPCAFILLALLLWKAMFIPAAVLGALIAFNLVGDYIMRKRSSWPNARSMVGILGACHPAGSPPNRIADSFDTLLRCYQEAVAKYAVALEFVFRRRKLLGRLSTKNQQRRIAESLSDFTAYIAFQQCSEYLAAHDIKDPAFLISVAVAIDWELATRPPEQQLGSLYRSGTCLDKYLAFEELREVDVPNKAAWLLAKEVAEVVSGPDPAIVVAAVAHLAIFEFDIREVFKCEILKLPHDHAARAAIEERVATGFQSANP